VPVNALGLVLLAAVLVLLRQPILLVLGAVTGYVHVVLSRSKFEFMVQDFWAALDKEILLSTTCT
jgi:C4-dicarboxylate transporter, DctM subunit